MTLSSKSLSCSLWDERVAAVALSSKAPGRSTRASRCAPHLLRSAQSTYGAYVAVLRRDARPLSVPPRTATPSSSPPSPLPTVARPSRAFLARATACMANQPPSVHTSLTRKRVSPFNLFPGGMKGRGRYAKHDEVTTAGKARSACTRSAARSPRTNVSGGQRERSSRVSRERSGRGLSGTTILR